MRTVGHVGPLVFSQDHEIFRKRLTWPLESRLSRFSLRRSPWLLVRRVLPEAMKQMRRAVKLKGEPSATHLLEESEALERVAELAGEWFVNYLSAVAPGPDELGDEATIFRQLLGA
jgi:hypothetical protein